MYVPFQDATFIPLTNDAGKWISGTIALPRVDALAAKDAQGRLWLSLTNVDPSRSVQVDVDLGTAAIRSATGETLTAAKVDSINTFAAPRTVAPKPLTASVANGRVRVTLEPKSVSVLALQP
jgi:alpha-N-arabinofuranosidase